MTGPEAIATSPRPSTESRPEQRAPEPAPPRSRSKLVPFLLLIVIAAAALGAWKIWFAKPDIPDNIVALSGRIEGDDSAIAPKTTGRILEIRVREGDRVKAGEVIAVLSDDQIRAREEQAQAAVSQAEARARSARDQVAILQAQLQQNRLSATQSRTDAEGRVRQAEADLAAAESDLAQRQAEYQIGLFDKEAYTRLAQTGAASERQGKQAAATADQQAAAVAAAKRRVEAARGALTTARANLDNPNIREAQVTMVTRQIGQQETAEIASVEASLQQARAQLREAQANRQDLIVAAPFDGTVATRAAEPGEVVTAGTTLVTLIDLTKVYLRGFVPEGQIGRVKIGQPCHVYLDSNTSRPIDASVLRIDPEATFTPENTYFREDRVKQVVGVKLQLKSAFGFAKPGMPADGEILVQGDQWPERNHRK